MIWALPLGLLVGATMGALGGGGAILAVPALVYLLGLDIHAATTASLLVVLLISLTGVWPHHGKGDVRWRDGLIFGAVGVVGSGLGTRASAGLDDALLQAAFACLLVVVAGLMVRQIVRSPATGGQRRRGLGWLLATATGVGLLTGFFGVGGGFAVVPALTLVLGFAMPVAVGTSILVIGVNTVTALVWRSVGAQVGGLDWPLVGLFGVAAVVGGQLGARLSTRLGPRTLKVAFTGVLVALALFMLTESVLALT